MADSTLEAIQKKVRRLTRSPSTSQLTDTELNEYINTFVLYDFPEHLRTFKLRQTLTFYTEPNQANYETSAVTTDPLFNFENKVIALHKPVYIAGYNVMVSQSREEFYNIYPILNSIMSTGQSGDGVTTNFTGTLSKTPVAKGYVTFTSQDSNGDGLYVNDRDGDGLLYDQNGIAAGTINYVTGAYNLTFSGAPATSEIVYSETVPYVAALPQALLFFEDKFVLRPIPDKVYPVIIEVDVRPTELMTGESPELEQWWQYISYGAAKKVFEDRMDLESVQLIMPEFKKQEALVNRTTIVNQTKERVATIYSEQTNLMAGNGFSGGGFGGS